MNKTQKKSSQPQHNPMSCCRVCLMSDCRLYSIYEYKLADTFTIVTGTVMARDRLPQYLCAYCYMLLLKYSSFRAMCHRTRQLFKWEMNTDGIRRQQVPQRSLNLTQTEVEIVEIMGSDEIESNNSYESDEEMSLEDDALEDDCEAEPYMEETETKIDKNIVDLLVVKDEIWNRESQTQDRAMVVEHSGEDDSEVEISNKTIENILGTKHTASKGKVGTQIGKTVIERSNEDDSHVEYIKDETSDTNFENILNPKDAVSKIKAETPRSYEDDSHVEYIEDETSDTNFENILSPKDTVSKIKAKTPKRQRKTVTKIGNVNAGECLLKTGKENREKMKMLTIELKDNNFEFNVADGSDDDDDFFYFEEIDDEEIMEDQTSAEISRPPKNEFDVEAFETQLNVTTVVLSQSPSDISEPKMDGGHGGHKFLNNASIVEEEQLEEIAIRKKSENNLEMRYQCEECGKGFEMEPAFNNHRARHTLSSGPHLCEICGVRYRKRSHLTDHKKSHQYKFYCNQCDFISRTQYQAKAHYEMHAGKTFECPHCGKVFKKSNTRLSHMRLAHPALNVACDECGETFVSSKGLQHHKNVAHGVRLQCTICSAVFVTSEALDRHRDTAGDHADLRPCEQCGENCASEEELQQHVEEAHPPRRCEKCDITFWNPAAFETHIQRQHVGKRYVGPHYTRPRTGTGRTQQYRPCICEQCGHLARNSTLLMYHMRSHLAVKPFACDHCTKTFDMKNKLVYHMRTHTGEKPYKCSECPLTFAMKGNLQRHHKTVHLKQYDVFSCEMCARTFTTKCMLKMHVKTIHEGMPWPKRTRRAKDTA